MFNEWYKPRSVLEFPLGGSQALVNALVRGVTKRGGRLHVRSHVDSILLEDGRATGVRLSGGGTVWARTAVVTNATLWDTQKLLLDGSFPDGIAAGLDEVPVNRSFMHLHVGFDAAGLDDLEMHHVVVNSWEPSVAAEQNVVLISIASVIDPSLAPKGKHTLHAYLPASEPYELWEGLSRKSEEYAALKEERSQVGLRGCSNVVLPNVYMRRVGYSKNGL
jgi:phytoene dehydrogenase-like protein